MTLGEDVGRGVGMRALDPGEPRVIGPYQLVGVIGAGGMGRVFLAVAPDGRLAAVKQVLAPLMDDPTFRARFVREVRASRSVSGAHTAAVLDSDPDAPLPWLASVFIPGPSLLEVVVSAGPLPEPTVRRLAAGVAAALADVHRVGLVHRDVKPANVLLTNDGPRVVDFGIARAADASTGLTGTGHVVGTLGYLAPEQLDGSPVGPAADVFALGSVLVFAATGSGPFTGDTPHALLYQMAFGEPDLSRVPPGLKPLITSLLARDPQQRPSPETILKEIGPVPSGTAWLPGNVRSLVVEREHTAQALAGSSAPDAQHSRAGGVPTLIAATSATTAMLPARPTSEGLPPGGRRPRHWIVVAAAIVAVLGIVVAALAVLNRPDETRSVAHAVALVAQITPSLTEIPNNYEIDPSGSWNPRPIGPGDKSYFGCVAASNPTPSEAGVTAGSTVSYVEKRAWMPKSRIIQNSQSVSVFYFDAARRGRVIGEVADRINNVCRTASPSWVQDEPIALDIPGVDEQVTKKSTLVEGQVQTATTCTFVRVKAIVVKGCADLDRFTGDTDPAQVVKALVAPVIDRARNLQVDDE